MKSGSDYIRVVGVLLSTCGGVLYSQQLVLVLNLRSLRLTLCFYVAQSSHLSLNKDMRHKLGLIIACMLGIWGCICIKLSKLDIGSTSRLRKAFQSGSPQVDISEEWRRATGSGTTGGREEGYHDSPRLRVTAGVNGSEPSRVDHRTPPRIVVKDTHSGRNDECQAVLDDRGNPSNLFTDPVLSMAKPTYGVVSGGEYSYYTVRWHYFLLP